MNVCDVDLSWASPKLKERLQHDPAAALRERGLNVPAQLPRDVIHEFARIAFLIWVDGTVVPIDQFHIDPADEGLLFGRGVWESTRTIDGVPWLWPAHLDRLLRTAALLHIRVEQSRLPDSAAVNKYVRLLSSQDVTVRLNVTAGPPAGAGIVWMSAAVQPVRAPSVTLRTCLSPVDKGQVYLTMKTFQYATRLRLGHDANAAGFDSALLLDAHENLLEAVHANVFMRLRTGWATPPADGGLLPGTVRRHLLEKAPLPIREQPISRRQLREVQEAFLTNSTFGIVPISRIDDWAYPVGAETMCLMRWLEPPATKGIRYRFLERQSTPR